MKSYWPIVCVWLACGGEEESPLPTTHAPPLADLQARGEPVPITPWLRAHFDSPVAPQGDAPESFGGIATGTSPEDCGTCHVTQYEDWKQSWHAMGMGPGIMGQLVDLDGSDDPQVAQCQRCHAPLSEQAPRILSENEDGSGAWSDNPHYVSEERNKGLTCTGCHVRKHQRYGPGNSPAIVAASEAASSEEPLDLIHEGAVIREEFKSPAFCRPCHDFDEKPRIGIGFDSPGNPDAGVLLSKVSEGGAGEEAGLKVGDRILSIEGQEVATGKDIKAIIELAGAGTELELRLERDSEFLRLPIASRATRAKPMGKMLQETTEEWRRTRYAEEGITCQNCHMPEGRHLWKGIHDRDMVASGLSSTASVTGVIDSDGFWSWLSGSQRLTAQLTATNVGAGHRLPTYTTPEIHLIMQQVDKTGALIEGTQQETVIARRMKPNLSEELYDTRLLPGESLTLEYNRELSSDASQLRAWVEVWPDEAYRRNYEIWLNRNKFPIGRAQLESAHQASIDSRYTLWTQDLNF